MGFEHNLPLLDPSNADGKIGGLERLAMPTDNSGRRVRFGAFELDVGLGQLRKHGSRISTPQQAIQILSLLLERPGEVVSREELYQKLWPHGVFVDFEHGLNAAVKKLRRSLGEPAENPRFIQTLPRLGYKFIGVVEEDSGTASTNSHSLDWRSTMQTHNEPASSCPNVEIGQEELPPKLTSALARWYRGISPWTLASAALCLIFVAIILFQQRSPDHYGRYGRIGITRVTATGKIKAAAISPDGKYVAYAASEERGESLWLRQLATGTEVEVVATSACNYRGLTFSADGARIYYSKNENGRSPALYSKTLLGGTETRIVENVPGRGSLSPDGKSFALIRTFASGESAVVVVQVEGSGERTLATRGHPAFFGSSNTPKPPAVTPPAAGPAWSPDGKTIACPAGDYRGYYGNIVTIPSAGGTPVALMTPKWWQVQALGWLSDGKGIVAQVVEEIGAPSQLRLVSYPTGEVHNITSDLNDYSSISLTTDSSAMVTLQSTVVSELSMVSGGKAAEAKQIHTATPLGAHMNVLSWTQDGRVVYVSRASGNENIWIAGPDGRQARQLTWFGRHNLQPQVCAGGQYIAFSSDRAGKLNIWRMSMDGTDWKRLTYGDVESRPACSPDGRWVFYTSHSATPKSIWKVPIDGGTPVRLIGTWAVSPTISPDGKMVAFRHWDDQLQHQRIAIIPSDVSDAPPRILDFDADYARWTRDSRSLLYVSRESGVDNIWRRSIAGGTPEPLTDFTTGSILNFDWSHDGRQLACVRGYTRSDIVLIREFRSSDQ
jgi:eukaryotic-like serine/threonine-protein kinase